MADYCDDNRFELINKYKQKLIDGTNIETAQDEMAVINDILFRFWQMGWLDKLEQSEQHWIPCSERLPDDGKEVLMSLAWGVDIGEYRDGEWHSEWINHYDDDNVIAWMPLPEPYKGDEDD